MEIPIRNLSEVSADIIDRILFTSRGDAISSVCPCAVPVAGNAKINPKLLLSGT